MMQGTFAQVEKTSLREAVGRALRATHNDHMVNLLSAARAHSRVQAGDAPRARRARKRGAGAWAIIDTVVSRYPEAVERLMREHIGQTRGRWAAPTRQRAD